MSQAKVFLNRVETFLACEARIKFSSEYEKATFFSKDSWKRNKTAQLAQPALPDWCSLSPHNEPVPTAPLLASLLLENNKPQGHKCAVILKIDTAFQSSP